MKKSIITLALIALPMFGLAQSKVSVEATGGILNIGKDIGENYELGFNYHISEVTTFKLSGLASNLDNRANDFGYQVLKFSLHAERRLAGSDDIEMGLLFGVSYLTVQDKLPLDKNDFTGLDLGLNINFFPKKKFSFGTKLVSTYAYEAPGGILQANGFVNYRF